MGILKLIVIYTVLIATIAFAHTTAFAGILYFAAGVAGMVVLHSPSRDNEENSNIDTMAHV